LTVAAEEEGEDPKQMEQESDHRVEIVAGSASTDQPLGCQTGFWRGTGSGRNLSAPSWPSKKTPSKSSVWKWMFKFLALFIGLWCPFCRRSIAEMGTMEGKLKAAGIETLGIVATTPENARLYFKFRPTRLRLGSDHELTTHRAYGLPKPASTPEFMKMLETTRINPSGQLPEARPVIEVAAALSKADGYVENQTDKAEAERQWPQLKGQFLIDREGIVRWAKCATEGVAGIGKFPSVDEVIAAASAAPAVSGGGGGSADRRRGGTGSS
jgi:peroxiredoxin